MALYSVARYKGRYWAVYDREDELVCVTVYRKGAREVAHRLAGAEGILSRLGLSPDKSSTIVADRDRDARYIPKNHNDRKKGQYQYGGSDGDDPDGREERAGRRGAARGAPERNLRAGQG